MTMEAEVIDLPRRVKVLCFYEVSFLIPGSTRPLWRKDTKMIEVLSSDDIPSVLAGAIADEQQRDRQHVWDRRRTTHRLLKYVPENGKGKF